MSDSEKPQAAKDGPRNASARSAKAPADGESKAAREARLAAALRANLRRRKDRARAAKAGDEEARDGED